MKDQIQAVEDQILRQQTKPPQLQDYDLQNHLAKQHDELLLKDEEFHLQRAKKNWATKGDRNTSFFHQAIIKRNRKNRITYLQNPDGSHSTTPDQIANTLTHYFQQIYTSNDNAGTTGVDHIRPPYGPTNSLLQVHEETQNHSLEEHTQEHTHWQVQRDATHHLFTNSTPDMQELHTIIRNMRSNASPGPDGLNAGFFKAAWPWISQDIHHLVTQFYSSASMQHKLNHTFITLIPKKLQPVIPQDFRPIGLCNVIYKLIVKTLADRLKPHLPDYIDHSQAVFIQNRHISSNIVIT